jgi:hypothetical protein
MDAQKYVAKLYEIHFLIKVEIHFTQAKQLEKADREYNLAPNY